jgi:uncharacterized protein YijF (DUF1287 family)
MMGSEKTLVWPYALLFFTGYPGLPFRTSAAKIRNQKRSIAHFYSRFHGKGVKDYPAGDVQEGVGVCTDVVIRAYRKLCIDLQELVHLDMKSHFSEYPSRRIWGLSRPDTNIDHRRVPNLQVFFSRHGQKLRATETPHDYMPGDLVTWMLPGNLPHIGIVTDRYNPTTNTPEIVHNIGRGPKLEDMLFRYPITRHYRYLP